MKKLFLLSLVSLALPACSLFHHSPDVDQDLAVANDQASGPQNTIVSTQGNLEQEVSRLKTRLEALETKLDVVSNSMERTQLKQSQPEITAVQTPQPTMSAPVADNQSDAAPAAPKLANKLPAKAVAVSNESDSELPAAAVPANPKNQSVEKDFKSAMVYFQAGRNLEAASKFGSVAKQYPTHLLAGHALYWAGEANARSQQWSNAIENWENVEKDYPHSTYLPETLAGLSRAFEAQGNSAKAKAYRDSLTRSFPSSPVTLNLVTHESHDISPAQDKPAMATPPQNDSTLNPAEEDSTEPQSTEQD